MWEKHAPGTLITEQDFRQARRVFFGSARREGTKILIPAFNKGGKGDVIFDLEHREIVVAGERIPMASIDRFDIDHYTQQGDLKTIEHYCLLIGAGNKTYRLTDYTKEYYEGNLKDIDVNNAQLIHNLHALPAACDLPCRQTCYDSPPDPQGAFLDQAHTPPGSPSSATESKGCVVLLLVIIVIALLLLVKRLDMPEGVKGRIRIVRQVLHCSTPLPTASTISRARGGHRGQTPMFTIRTEL
jgi:hypothetical protein